MAKAFDHEHTPNWAEKTCSCGKRYVMVQKLAYHLRTLGYTW